MVATNPPPGRRVQLDRKVHINDRTNSVPALIKDEHLQQFVFENFSNRKIAYCSKGNPCRRRICPWCALSRVAARTRWDTSETVATFAAVIELVLTTPSQAMLADAWLVQHSVRSKFMANSWLSKNTDGWLRETEVTVEESGWHVHDHMLLFLDTAEFERLKLVGDAAVGRWLRVAAGVQVAAGPASQYCDVKYNVHERLLYVTKGLMTQKPNRTENAGYTPADVLAMWVAGEVRGMEWWCELEALFESRRRWRAKGGPAFKGQSIE